MKYIFVVGEGHSTGVSMIGMLSFCTSHYQKTLADHYVGYCMRVYLFMYEWIDK